MKPSRKNLSIAALAYGSSAIVILTGTWMGWLPNWAPFGTPLDMPEESWRKLLVILMAPLVVLFAPWAIRRYVRLLEAMENRKEKG